MKLVKSDIPIFITVRGNTLKVMEKHREALKFMYVFIKNQQILEQTYIISDNKYILDYAKELGFINTIHYPCKTDKEILYLEYFATYKFSKENNYYPDWFILLNINQLFLSSNIIPRCIRFIDNKYDIITSYTEISNRSEFFVDEKLNNKNNTINHLLTSEHDRVKMSDAAIYAIKTDFAHSCMNFEDPSYAFWKGKIKYFKNDSVYTDIYTTDDIYKYYNIINRIKDVQNFDEIKNGRN